MSLQTIITNTLKRPPYKVPAIVPFTMGEGAYHTCPSGLKIYGTVWSVSYDKDSYDAGKLGCWWIEFHYYPVVDGKQDESQIYTTVAGSSSFSAQGK